MNSKIIYFRLTYYNGLSLERSVLDDAVLLQEVPVPVWQVRLAAPLVVTLSQRESQLEPHQTLTHLACSSLLRLLGWNFPPHQLFESFLMFLPPAWRHPDAPAV